MQLTSRSFNTESFSLSRVFTESLKEGTNPTVYIKTDVNRCLKVYQVVKRSASLLCLISGKVFNAPVGSYLT